MLEAEAREKIPNLVPPPPPPPVITYPSQIELREKLSDGIRACGHQIIRIGKGGKVKCRLCGQMRALRHVDRFMDTVCKNSDVIDPRHNLPDIMIKWNRGHEINPDEKGSIFPRCVETCSDKKKGTFKHPLVGDWTLPSPPDGEEEDACWER